MKYLIKISIVLGLIIIGILGFLAFEYFKFQSNNNLIEIRSSEIDFDFLVKEELKLTNEPRDYTFKVKFNTSAIEKEIDSTFSVIINFKEEGGKSEREVWLVEKTKNGPDIIAKIPANY